jgi:hypothetical protein
VLLVVWSVLLLTRHETKGTLTTLDKFRESAVDFNIPAATLQFNGVDSGPLSLYSGYTQAALFVKLSVEKTFLLAS